MVCYQNKKGEIIDFYLTPPFEVKEYKKGDDISLFSAPLLDNGIKIMIKEAEESIKIITAY